LLAWLIALPQEVKAASSPSQPIPPSGWQTYTNSIYAYQISYPATWHAEGGDPRFNQHFTNFQPTTEASDGFPAAGTNIKFDVNALAKPTTQSLYDWLSATDADLWPAGPPDKPGWVAPIVERTRTIAGLPIDPFGWSGSYSDPRAAYDLGYLWSTGTQSNPSPSFVGGTLYTVTPTLHGPGQYWFYQASDQYGVSSYWTYTNAGASPTNWGVWTAPVGLNMSCGGAEVWIPSGDATATAAKYIISFSDGTPNLTVTVNQNANTSWYTIYDWYSGGHPITQILLGDNTGTDGQKIAVAKVWFSCVTG
jgi:hypothetical protein